ncbi:MAG: hypothetical protein U9O56_10780 [Campylobacterota bacterium]|nr:hypothetical protein [Campylobacterota bacterium]
MLLFYHFLLFLVVIQPKTTTFKGFKIETPIFHQKIKDLIKEKKNGKASPLTEAYIGKELKINDKGNISKRFKSGDFTKDEIKSISSILGCLPKELILDTELIQRDEFLEFFEDNDKIDILISKNNNLQEQINNLNIELENEPYDNFTIMFWTVLGTITVLLIGKYLF